MISDENSEASIDEMVGDYKKSKFLAEKIIIGLKKKKKIESNNY